MTLAGRSVEIVYTGLREGEKLHEELFGTDEVDRRPIHPLVSHVDVPSADPEYMAERGAAVGAAAAMRELGVAATIPSERVGQSAADMAAGRDSVVRWQPV
jgi:FlaA1/EpsC-like NDP-sugar epimerase